MIEKILDIAFSGFWNFIGVLTLIYLVLYFLVNGIGQMWGRFMRMLMIRKHGWPTNGLDGDGDPIEKDLNTKSEKLIK